MKSALVQKLSAETDAKLPALLAKLDAFLSARGVCWQGLWSHSDAGMPEETKEAAPDRLDAKAAPTDPAWSDMLAGIDAITGCALAVDQYGGSGKRGYVILQRVKDEAGQLWQCALNYGPEAWRAYDWRQVSA